MSILPSTRCARISARSTARATARTGSTSTALKSSFVVGSWYAVRTTRDAARRASYSLFALQMNDAECEALRPYLFGRPIPRRPGERPVTCLNLVDGDWVRPSEVAAMKSLADRRVTLCEIARSRDAD